MLLRGDITKRAEKWPNWLMMTSSGDDNWLSGSLGLLTDKTIFLNRNQADKSRKSHNERFTLSTANFRTLRVFPMQVPASSCLP